MNLKKTVIFLFLCVIVTAIITIVIKNASGQIDPSPIPEEKANETTLKRLKELDNRIEEKISDKRNMDNELDRTIEYNTITYYIENGKLKPYPVDILSLSKFSNPHYGENSLLYQFVDNYYNMDYIAFNYSIVRNETSNCLELKWVSGGKQYQDFNDYTEIDPDERIDILAWNRAYHRCYRSEDNRLYYDFGADYFDDFEHEISIYFDLMDELAYGTCWFISDYPDGLDDHYTNNYPFLAIRPYRDNANPSGNRMLQIYEKYDGGTQLVNSEYISEDTWYYLTIIKDDTDFTCNIYTDETRETLFDSIALTIQEDYTFRYFQALNTRNQAGYNYNYDMELKDVWLGDYSSGYAEYGVFYTDNLLDGTTALQLLFNSSIPEDSEIKISISDDNETWKNHNNGSGYDSIGEGFEGLDLRDLNYTTLYVKGNMTGYNTPRLYQLRLISFGAIGETTEDYSPLFIIGFCLGMVIFIGVGINYRSRG